jgi:hypothetical protein
VCRNLVTRGEINCSPPKSNLAQSPNQSLAPSRRVLHLSAVLAKAQARNSLQKLRIAVNIWSHQVFLDKAINMSSRPELKVIYLRITLQTPLSLTFYRSTTKEDSSNSSNPCLTMVTIQCEFSTVETGTAHMEKMPISLPGRSVYSSPLSCYFQDSDKVPRYIRRPLSFDNWARMTQPDFRLLR